MSQESFELAEKELDKYQKSYRHSEWKWKYGYRILLGISALLTTSSVLVGKLEYLNSAASSDIAALLAGLATLVTTLIAAFNFESNWINNKKSRVEVQALMLETKKSEANPDRILSQLQQVIRQKGNTDVNPPD